MAHLEKYKAPSAPHLSDHYTREKGCFTRDNIDSSLSQNNYALDFVIQDEKLVVTTVQPEKPKNRVKQRIEDVEKSNGKKVRKDAVVMADLVLTLPENVPGADEQKFFEQSYSFLGSKLGNENLLGCWVHKDEPNARTHAHIPFTPVLDGKFNFKNLCPRSFYQTLHRELGDYLEKALGYRPEIELNEEKAGQKALSSVPQEKLNEARAALDKELQPLRQEKQESLQRLEYLRQEEVAVRNDIKQLNQRIGDVLEEIESKSKDVSDFEEKVNSITESAAQELTLSEMGVDAIQDLQSEKEFTFFENLFEKFKAKIKEILDPFVCKIKNAFLIDDKLLKQQERYQVHEYGVER